MSRGVSAREFIAALEADGFYKARTEGSHRRYKHSDGRAVTVAYHHTSDTFVIQDAFPHARRYPLDRRRSSTTQPYQIADKLLLAFFFAVCEPAMQPATTGMATR